MSINQNNKIINESINAELNPMVIQLQEFGYDNIYSRRVFYYLHPEDIDEALNYMSIENGIIQHRFIKDKRNLSNKKCYICDENEEIHLRGLNNNLNITNNEKIEENKQEINTENNATNLNQINKSINVNNNKDLESSINTSNIKYGISDIQNINKLKSELKTKLDESNDENKNKLKKSLASTNIDKMTNKYIGSEINILNASFEIKKDADDKEKIDIAKTKFKLKSKEEKKECEVCNEIFTVNEINKLEKCGHSFCLSCWYDSLSVKIKENKLSSIKCLDYNCEEKIPDYFIVNILKSDKNLLKIYQRYKLELEVLADPNKKLCPYPNCDSYLELKKIHNKDVTCSNNHTFCFLCLKLPHGNLPCNGSDLDKSVIEFAKNNFVKKCPKCQIIIEKNKGCNHITCKCGYQWCWLCNEQYNENHFKNGKCKGFQFYQPKNDYDIKLAIEGKINANELSNSQRQFDDNLNINIVDEIPHQIHFGVEEIRRDDLDEEGYQYKRCSEKTLKTIVFIFFGNCIFNLIKLEDYYEDCSCYAFPVYLFLNIALIMQIIFLNIISFILILIFIGFKRFILDYEFLKDIYFQKVNLISFNSLFWIFCKSYKHAKKALNNENYSMGIKMLMFLSYFIISFICFFPFNILINICGMIYTLINAGGFSPFITSLSDFFN